MSGKPNQMWKRGSQNERNHLPWLTLSDGGDETIHRKTKPHELFFSFLFPPKHARPRLLTFVVLLFFLTFLPGSPHLDCFSFLLLRSREDGSFVNDTYENNEPHHCEKIEKKDIFPSFFSFPAVEERNASIFLGGSVCSSS
mmetsp:Transcript_25539/g.64031  ORF Transcript_25539/g.64031 Transcript_25539/m.64031 type:complete len:141 (+) Transcript_25539:1657-2079(+)